MNLPDGFEQLDEHFTIRVGGARALFTTRRGGHSQGPYESLNLGRLTDDDPELVAANRASIEAQLQLALSFAHQVHGSEVLSLAEPVLNGVEADGQATGSSGIAPAVTVADCLPIAIAAQGAVAMVHAGWRGLAAGVIDAGARAVRELSGTGPLEAAVGPGAGACCYEVGEEVHRVFATRFPDARRGNNLDLKTIARSLLEQAGVSGVQDIGLCTICGGEKLFFSHRRDHGLTGRQAGIAWLS